MTKAQRHKKVAAAVAVEDVRILSVLAERLNARPLRLLRRDKLDIAARYLRRFRGLSPWHKGGHHVGRYDFGPMIFETKDGLAVDPRNASA